jgi:translation initiation factor IF-2
VLLQKEKVRVYVLARELGVDTKDLLEMCRTAGMDVKNQLSSLDPEQRDQIELRVKKGGNAVAVLEAPPPPQVKVAPPPELGRPIRNLDQRRPPVRREPSAPLPTQTHQAPIPKAEPPAVSVVPPPPEPPVVAAPAAQTPSVAPPPAKQAEPPATPTVAPETPAAVAQPVPPRVPELPPKVPSIGPAKVPDLGSRGDGTQRPARKRHIPPPVFARVATPPPLKQRPLREEKKAEPAAQKPIARPPVEDLKKLEAGPQGVQHIVNKALSGDTPVPPAEIEDEEGESPKGKRSPGGVPGRDQRHIKRNERAKQRRGREGETRSLLVTAEDDRPQRTKQRLERVKKRQLGPTQPRKGKVPVELPITVRALSEAIGAKSGELLFKLRDHGLQVNSLNVTLDPDVAEAIALEYGCELDIKRPADAEEQVLRAAQQPDNPEDLLPRAPIVAVMGHVDHGKTSLLDRIRKSNVAATEAGGITQVIRAWRVDHGGRPVTFLDTPGHEAFTKMRARGANVTDIAVIVVAADDGVMPQTEEAINHAKAAGVWLVIAINKVDLPNANVNKTRQQLYSLSVLPDNMGGDVPFVETSAATGKGIDELLEQLAVIAELKELKANPNKPARGTCLEAMLTEGEGVVATLLVQDGTLHRGDVVLCGATYGRVRALYDDLGRPIQEAGPSVPVRITGLNEVPNADDPFLIVPDLAQARAIAEKRRAKQQEAAVVKREPVKLEQLSEAKIAELKVILKADFRGSIEAIRKELEKLQHAEVRVRVLHTGIGAITESDVQLALTSPQDTIIVGFNVIPDDRAKTLAEERSVQIRQYDIIYQLTDDVRAALEGKLKPREEVIHLGRAVVRKTFKIGRVGTVAGCYVTQGTIERSARVRLIRQGVVIYPPPGTDRTVSLESLRRVKDDVREVREGYECGIKVAGYDDIKVDDVIEAFRVEQVQRTLELERASV